MVTGPFPQNRIAITMLKQFVRQREDQPMGVKSKEQQSIEILHRLRNSFVFEKTTHDLSRSLVPQIFNLMKTMVTII